MGRCQQHKFTQQLKVEQGNGSLKRKKKKPKLGSISGQPVCECGESA